VRTAVASPRDKSPTSKSAFGENTVGKITVDCGSAKGLLTFLMAGGIVSRFGNEATSIKR